MFSPFYYKSQCTENMPVSCPLSFVFKIVVWMNFLEKLVINPVCTCFDIYLLTTF